MFLKKEPIMADISIVSDKSGNALQFHNPAVHPLPQGAGQPMAIVKDGSGKVVSTSGQVPNTSVVFSNPG